jgi:hypothetical protein
MVKILRINLIFLILLWSLIACQKSSVFKSSKAPVTHEEKLSFYQGQIFSFETDIDFHLKHRLDFSIASDYVKLEETLLSLSTLLEKPEQDIIEQLVKDMKVTIDTFQKVGSYYLLNRDIEKKSTILRKLKKTIIEKEKLKAKEKSKQEAEKTEKEKPKQEVEKTGIEK